MTCGNEEYCKKGMYKYLITLDKENMTENVGMATNNLIEAIQSKEYLDKCEHRKLIYCKGLSERNDEVLRDQGFNEFQLAMKPSNKIGKCINSMKDRKNVMDKKEMVCVQCVYYSKVYRPNRNLIR